MGETKSATGIVRSAPREVGGLDDCLFYHTAEVPGYGLVEGFWDLRGGEDEYLGGVELAGRRVLEVGPASGHLTFHMERRGADVVSIEAADVSGWELHWDLFDEPPQDLRDYLARSDNALRRIVNSYWFCHRAYRSRAGVYYGSVNDVPRELGEFDVAVLGCVLLHSKNPLRLLEHCARSTREAVVVVEPAREWMLAQTTIEFLQRGRERWWDTWWGFSPKYFVDLLRGMGFSSSRVTFHTQTAFAKPIRMFTVVARREGDAGRAAVGDPVRLGLSSPVELLRFAPGELSHLPVRVVCLSAGPASSSSEPPVLLSYHWRDETGRAVVWDGLRTPLPRPLYQGDGEEVLIGVRTPEAAGRYTLEITVLEEGSHWHDDPASGLPLKIEATVE
jgi:SAM-dependent methyltransferase